MDVTIYFDIDGTLVHRDEHADDVTGAAEAFDLAVESVTELPDEASLGLPGRE